jgi:hypothetical protein
LPTWRDVGGKIDNRRILTTNRNADYERFASDILDIQPAAQATAAPMTSTNQMTVPTDQPQALLADIQRNISSFVAM